MVAAAAQIFAQPDIAARGATLDIQDVSHQFALEGQPLPVLERWLEQLRRER